MGARKKKLTTHSTKSGLARAIGVDRGTVARWCQVDGFPGGADGPWPEDAIRLWVEIREAQREESRLLEGPDSPALERYRLAKAELAEWELAQRRESMFSRADVLRTHQGYLVVLRRFADRLLASGLEEESRMAHEACDECEQIVESEFGDPPSDGGFQS